MGAMVALMLPLPVPEAPDVMVIHAAPGVVVHVQPAGVVSDVVTVPPAGDTACEMAPSE